MDRKYKIYNLINDDIEDYIGQDEVVYPDVNNDGYKLYDANDSMPLSDEERLEMLKKLEVKFEEVMDILRISKNDPNSRYTPTRIARMYVNELFNGRYEDPPKITVFPNRNKVQNLVISKGIKVMSVCSHHWQPISGSCIIGYIPDKHVMGISKLTRIVNWFARRPQIQEELGEQIADFIEDLVKPHALGVVINAKHYCMIARGVNASETNSEMITSVVRGWLHDDFNLRNEFMNLVKGQQK
jgi:GTP cyclohydrolase I